MLGDAILLVCSMVSQDLRSASLPLSWPPTNIATAINVSSLLRVKLGLVPHNSGRLLFIVGHDTVLHLGWKLLASSGGCNTHVSGNYRSQTDAAVAVGFSRVLQGVSKLVPGNRVWTYSNPVVPRNQTMHRTVIWQHVAHVMTIWVLRCQRRPAWRDHS